MRPHIARGTFSRSEYSEPPKVLPQPMDAADKPTSAAGRKALNDPRIHRYYVRLTSEQNERFLRMYEQSGMKNKADFICHRIFG